MMGVTNIMIIKVLVKQLTLGCPSVNMVYRQEGVFSYLFGLVEKHPFNNVLHNLVSRAVSWGLEANSELLTL